MENCLFHVVRFFTDKNRDFEISTILIKPKDKYH